MREKEYAKTVGKLVGKKLDNMFYEVLKYWGALDDISVEKFKHIVSFHETFGTVDWEEGYSHFKAKGIPLEVMVENSTQYFFDIYIEQFVKQAEASGDLIKKEKRNEYKKSI